MMISSSSFCHYPFKNSLGKIKSNTCLFNLRIQGSNVKNYKQKCNNLEFLSCSKFVFKERTPKSKCRQGVVTTIHELGWYIRLRMSFRSNPSNILKIHSLSFSPSYKQGVLHVEPQQLTTTAQGSVRDS